MSNERKDDGGSAFPCQPQWWDPDDMAYRPGDWVPGLTVRDYFAIRCLPISRATFPEGMEGGWDALAAHAYGLADAMLKARQA